MATDDANNFGSPPLNHRAFQRDEVSITAWIREQGAGRQRVEVVDLSRTGFRMSTAAYIPEGQIVYLTLPGYAPLEARIAWRRQEVYGCQFELRLHEAIYDHIVGKYPDLGR